SDPPFFLHPFAEPHIVEAFRAALGHAILFILLDLPTLFHKRPESLSKKISEHANVTFRFFEPVNRTRRSDSLRRLWPMLCYIPPADHVVPWNCRGKQPCSHSLEIEDELAAL